MADAMPFDGIVGQKKRRINGFRVLVYAVLITASIVYVLPFAFMIGKSLQNQSQAITSPSMIPTELNFQNYSEVLVGSTDIGDRSQFLHALGTTVLLEVFSVTGQTIVCVLGAYAFARMRFPGRNIIFAMLLLTLFVPSTIILVPNLIIVTRISRAFEAISPALKWMNNWPSLVIPFLANTFSIFLLRQFFLQIPDDLWDAARIDGAGHGLFLVRVAVPISGAAIMTTILFCFVGVWSALEWPLLVADSPDWRPIAVALTNFTTEGSTKVHLLMAASVISLLPIMILYFFTQRFFTQGISTTGLK